MVFVWNHFNQLFIGWGRFTILVVLLRGRYNYNLVSSNTLQQLLQPCPPFLNILIIWGPWSQGPSPCLVRLWVDHEPRSKMQDHGTQWCQGLSAASNQEEFLFSGVPWYCMVAGPGTSLGSICDWMLQGFIGECYDWVTCRVCLTCFLTTVTGPMFGELSMESAI